MDVGQPYLLANEVSKMLVRIIVTLPFLPCFVVAEPVEAATFIYTLSSELKKPNCAYDYAWIAAPHYFYDEDEEYAYAPYTDASSPYANLHFRRKDFFQVRPFGDPASWSPTSSSWKQVQIVYFFLHPHDGGIGGGHQGDGERVKFVAKSQDLKRWQITSGLYDAHGKHFYYSASYLSNIADSIGSSHPPLRRTRMAMAPGQGSTVIPVTAQVRKIRFAGGPATASAEKWGLPIAMATGNSRRSSGT